MARILLHVSPPDVESAKSYYRKFLELGGKPDPALQASLESAAAPAPESFTNAPAVAPTNAPVTLPTDAGGIPPTNAPVMPPSNAPATLPANAQDAAPLP